MFRVNCRFLVVLAIYFAIGAASVAGTADEPNVVGSLTANGETIELAHVYVWAEEEGFYAPDDPTWTILFLEHPVEERELGGFFFDSAWVRLGITESSEFGESELQVYAQSLKLSADAGGNISGGDYPILELESASPDRFAGRVYHPDPQEFFDDTFQYDFTFSAPLSDPNAPIGGALAAGGGEPGRAYLRWIEAVQSGDPEKLAAVVPSEMATQLRERPTEEVQEEIEFMQLMTPTDVTILSGSSDGETAILEVEAMMEGEKLAGEVTLVKNGDFWIPTKTSW